MADHSRCIAELHEDMAPYEVTVSEPRAVVLIPGPLAARPYLCDHGRVLWMEPTGEEVARMAARGSDGHA